MPTPAGRLALPAACLLLAGLLAPCAWSADWGADESTLLWEAARLAGGGTIYRDFVTFLPPGAATLLGALYGLTGPSLATAHLLSAVAAGVVALLLAAIARARGLTGPAAFLPALLYVPLLYWPNPTLSHHGLALVWFLGALAAALHSRWLVAGLCAGLALVTTQTDGVLALAVLFAGLALKRQTPRAAGLVLAGALVPLALTLAWLGAHGVAGEAWQQAVRWPLANYKRPGGFNDIKWLTDLPGLLSPATPAWHGLAHWYARTLWVLAPYALLLGALVGLWRRRDEEPEPFLPLAALGSLAVCLNGRADYLHTVAYAAPALALGAEWAWQRRDGLALGALGLAAAAGAGCFAVTMRLDPGAWLSLRSPDARYREQPALVYLREHAGPSDPVIAGPWGGAIYRDGHPAATRYTLLTPPAYRYHQGEDRAAIDRDLEGGRALYVVTLGTTPEELFGHGLPGYRLEATRDLGFHGLPLPCRFYRREALKPRSGAAEVGIRPIR